MAPNCNQIRSQLAFGNFLELLEQATPLNDNGIAGRRLAWAQDMLLPLDPMLTAKHECSVTPRVWAHKANPSLNSPLSNSLSSNILCDSIVVHAGQNQLPAHEQTSWAWALTQNKIRQTCLE